MRLKLTEKLRIYQEYPEAQIYEWKNYFDKGNNYYSKN